MATSTPPSPADAVPPASLGLFGRDVDLQTVRSALAEARLVSVIGPGGVGKTRLATAIVAGWSSSPARFCELGPVSDPTEVPDAMAQALGFPSIDATAVGWSGDGLLVVDNAEHHLDVVAGAVGQLLTGCAGLAILVTSREPLAMPDEQVVALEPLAVGDSDDPSELEASPAVQLFLARAGALGVRFADDALPTVAAIVRSLDGLPLAIELAAARTRGLGLHDILRHLDARFDLLTRRHDRGPDRHRSLEATIDWSYQRLDPPLQRFFSRLGAFPGPFTVEAAVGVAAPDEPVTATLDRLDALVSRSLINADDHDGQTAYSLPESLRLYARQRLTEEGASDACDSRFVDHYVGLAADQAERVAKGCWSIAGWATVANANLNLRDAIRWCLLHDTGPARAATLFSPLFGPLPNNRAATVRELGELVLARWPEPRDERWAVTAAITGTATLADGDVARGEALAKAAVDVGSSVGSVIGARACYLVATHGGDGHTAMGWLDRVASDASTLGMEPFALECEMFRAATLAQLGEFDAARRTAVEARRRVAASESDLLLYDAELILGAVVAPEQPDEGRRAFEHVAALAQRSNHLWIVGRAQRALGAVAAVGGDVSAAVDAFGRSLDTFLEAGQLGEVAGTLRWVAGLLVAAGRPEAAAALLLPVEPSPPLLATAERSYLEPLLATLSTDAVADTSVPAQNANLRSVIAGARAALAELATGTAQAPQASPRDATADVGVAAAVAAAVPNRWIREGAVWELTYQGRTVRLPHAKGLSDLATLLERPAHEVAAADLMGAVVDSADLGPTIDDQARRAYERRIRDLQEDLEEAEDFGDLRRAEVAREELDQLIDSLASATGLAGRSRRVGGTDERARSAVTRRIRDAMRRVGEIHPPLGEHLAATVRTGRWCVYSPAEPREWMVVTGP